MSARGGSSPIHARMMRIASKRGLLMVVIATPAGIEEILPLIAKGGDIDIVALSQKVRGS